MASADRYGRESKSSFTYIETMSFQALDFYRRLGFELELTRSGYSRGICYHYLKKGLRRAKESSPKGRRLQPKTKAQPKRGGGSVRKTKERKGR